MNETPTPANHKEFRAKDGLVHIRTTTALRRWPPHDYPVVMVELRPRPGSRVLALPNSAVEWAPRFSEVLALILQLGLEVSTAPPDKPESRRKYWGKINARRRSRKSS